MISTFIIVFLKTNNIFKKVFKNRYLQGDEVEKMSNVEKKVKRGECSEELFKKFETQIVEMEDEIIECRKELPKQLSPSSFSYYLYEEKVRRFRKNWEYYKSNQELSMQENCRNLKKLMKERILEVLKQDKITWEDYPENEQVDKMKDYHEMLCIPWIMNLHFNE